MKIRKQYQVVSGVSFWVCFSSLALAQVTERIGRDSITVARSPYLPLRYEENWSYLQDESLRTDPLDRLKYIPLGRKKSHYLTLGGEVRFRFEYYHHENWGASPFVDNGYYQQRVLFHADAHVGDHLRVFGQLKSALTFGRKGGPRPVDENQLDVHQLFVDLSRAARFRWNLRIGRQEFLFGNGKLVDNRDGLNAPLSFDAIRLTVGKSLFKVDAFVSQPVLSRLGRFDDASNPGRLFWGVYGSVPLRSESQRAVLDGYYLGLRNKIAVFEQGAGRELRHTVGARLHGTRSGWEYDTEEFLQWGHFADKKLVAWGLTANLAYRFRASPAGLRLGLGGGISSGDGGPSGKAFGTFNPLFPTGFYFGPPAAPIGPSNLISLEPTVEVSLLKNLRILSSWNILWRQRTEDGLYSPLVTLVRSPQNSHARYIGSQLNLTALCTLGRHITFFPSYAWFQSGLFLRETGPSENVHYVMVNLAAKF